jgi:FkbM family methyltransferase
MELLFASRSFSLIFYNAKTIARLGPSLSTLKMLLMAAATSRPYLRGICLALLGPFIRDGEIAVHYQCYGRSFTAYVRLSDFESDWQSVSEIALHRIYEIEPGFSPDLVIDGGGNTGLFSLFASAAFPAAKIVVAEPVPRNLVQIAKHLRINSVDAEVQPVCIGGRQRTIPFYLREANKGSFDPGLPYSSRLDVPVHTLVSLIRGHNAHRILIKLDIEGMEVEALESFLPEEKRAVFVVGEVHSLPSNGPLLTRIFKRNAWTVRYQRGSDLNCNFTAWSPEAALFLAGQVDGGGFISRDDQA